MSMGVRDIMNRVLPIGPGNMSACCNYNYQILDKYCASQRTVSGRCLHVLGYVRYVCMYVHVYMCWAMYSMYVRYFS